jgi:cytochrome c553
MRIVLTIAALVAASSLSGDEPASKSASAEDTAFFEARILPILAERCLECHGSKKQKSGLRLDSRAAMLKGGDSGPAVVPGQPEESPLIEAVRYEGEPKMPPSGRLAPQAIADLEAWVKRGAPWPETAATLTPGASAQAAKRHWAFQPIRPVPLPEVSDRTWPRGAIDRFILAQLEARGLTPSPPADRRALIRRATFDLTGLPPTSEEVETFVADLAPDAFERVVDRLLASPRYGERWGRYWLDVARYADTKGYVFFEDVNYPWAYTYRDYVIHALNEDLPYDRFILEQLAADRLPLGADQRPLRALGFLTVGGRFMDNKHDIIDDRIDVVTRGLMGLTVACARCHDHKYDPVSQKDYYALYGVFASAIEPDVPPVFEPPPQTPAYEAFAQELQKREQKLRDFVRSKHAEIIEDSKKRAAEYLLAAQAALGAPSTEDFMLITDGGDLNPPMFLRWKALLERTRESRDPVFAPWHALAGLPAEGFAEKAAEIVARFVAPLDSSEPINPIIARALADRPPRSLTDVAQTYGRLLNATELIWQDWARRARLNGQDPPPPLPDPDREAIRLVFHGPEAPPNLPFQLTGEFDLLTDRTSQETLKKLQGEVNTWRVSGPGAPARAMTLEDTPTPFEPHVFLRGNPNNLGEPVPRRFIAFLSGAEPKPFREGSGRLELAQAIVARDNPLTARVVVNRVWTHHFGAPLVGTPGDFGLRGEPPSHPELLDHLAARFMDEGWSLKILHKWIMLSSVYQQASDDRSECQRVDPENHLLWKMNRRRLDFEATRDALLAVAGRLDGTIGGPPDKQIAAATSTRRTLYGFIDRLNLPGLYRAFDFPDPHATSPRRDLTTVAPQALFLMNHPFVLAMARATLQRPEIAREPEWARRVDRLYRLLYSRPPTADEIALAHAFLGDARDPSDSWAQYVQALLIANEFVFID